MRSLLRKAAPDYGFFDTQTLWIIYNRIEFSTKHFSFHNLQSEENSLGYRNHSRELQRKKKVIEMPWTISNRTLDLGRKIFICAEYIENQNHLQYK